MSILGEHDDSGLNNPKEVWVVKGIVTDPEAYNDSDQLHTRARPPMIGDPEWRFYDTHPDNPGSSSDYLDLEKGLADHDGYRIHYVRDVPDDVVLIERWNSLAQSYSPSALCHRLRDAALDQGFLGALLDAVDERR